jgi:hypothetical protein
MTVSMSSTYSGTPTFQPTGIESPIGKYALQLVTDLRDITHVMGTAILIAPGVALTAGHIFDACEQAYGPVSEPAPFAMYALQYGSPAEMHVMDVQRVFRARFTDLALLQLRGETAWLPSEYPRLDLRLPKAGQKIFAFGYPGRATTVATAIEVVANGHTTTGEVLEVYRQKRDSVRAPFPCFSTNARFDDSMSGGPVFNEEGSLMGVVCSNLPPETPEEEHYSIVTLLWPLVAMEIDIPWPEGSAERYKMFEYLSACGHRVIGLDQIAVEGGVVSCRWDEEPG